MPDVVVIGGGVIGLSAAFELAESGLSVRVLEQGMPGREASWAGAGMLPPGNPDVATGPEPVLRGHSHRLWPEWAARITDRSGIATEFARCGGVEVRLGSSPIALDDEVAAWRREGVTVEPLSTAGLRDRYPHLSREITAAYVLPEWGQVRNPRLLKALVAACATRGVTISAGHPVVGFEQIGDRVVAARTPAGPVAGEAFVIAGGAWSGELLRQVGVEIPIEPVRGQIVLLQKQPPLFGHVIQSGARYLVPRSDGRVLVGATEEHAGFVKANTSEGVQGLLMFATQLVPALATAQFEQCWSGLRPHRAGGLPVIGCAPLARNVIVAAGHFRAGLQLSPITAVLVRQLVCGQPTLLPVEWFS
uniref:Glycine oxidase ThiO n=1 Tax=Schlesneria paludicola TaxID=360056 RepID=A0A7C2K0J7_9PLAN